MQECYVFTTLRYDEIFSRLEHSENTPPGSPIYLLQYHHDRLIEAATSVFGTAGHDVLISAGIGNALQLQRRVQEAIAEQSKDPALPQSFRVRLQLDKDARMTIAVTPVQEVAYERVYTRDFDELPVDQTVSWTVHLDAQPTSSSIHTRCKTHDRSDYNRARSDTGIESFAIEQEVLLYNEAGYIFDASITTPYFFRNDKWNTPSASYGGQRGTTRRWALTNAVCIEGDVHMDSVQNDEIIWLSNAVRGFFRARVCR